MKKFLIIFSSVFLIVFSCCIGSNVSAHADNSLTKVVLDNCDSTVNTDCKFTDKASFVEGSGCLTSYVSYSPQVALNFNEPIVNNAISEKDAYLSFYICVETIYGICPEFKLNINTVGGGLYKLNLKPFDLKSGWNFICASFADGVKVNNPDIARVSGLMIEIRKDITLDKTDTYIKVDDIAIINKSLLIAQEDIKIITNTENDMKENSDTVKDHLDEKNKENNSGCGSIVFNGTDGGFPLIPIASSILFLTIIILCISRQKRRKA